MHLIAFSVPITIVLLGGASGNPGLINRIFERAYLHIDHIVIFVAPGFLLDTGRRVLVLMIPEMSPSGGRQAALGRRRFGDILGMLMLVDGCGGVEAMVVLVVIVMIGVLSDLVIEHHVGHAISALLASGLDNLVGLLMWLPFSGLLDGLLRLISSDHVHVLQVLEDALLFVKLRVQLFFLFLLPLALRLLDELLGLFLWLSIAFQRCLILLRLQRLRML